MELTKGLRHLALVAALFAATTTSACGADNDPASVTEAASPSPEAAAPSVTEAASPIEDRWIQHLTHSKIRTDLKAAGLAKWAEKYIATEEFTDPQTVVWDFDTASDSFSVAYYMPDGTWHVGWKGPLDVDDTTMTITDDFSSAVDTFAWKIKSDEMTLTRKGASSLDSLKGIPMEVYDVAYLSEPLTRTDCAMNPGQDC